MSLNIKKKEKTKSERNIKKNKEFRLYMKKS